MKIGQNSTRNPMDPSDLAYHAWFKSGASLFENVFWNKRNQKDGLRPHKTKANTVLDWPNLEINSLSLNIAIWSVVTFCVHPSS